MSRFSFFSGKVRNLKLRWARTSPQRYICFLRKQGCSIGKNLKFHGSLKNISIDLTRPSLITIGDNVHFGRNVTVLKGVTIGNNVLVGINSVVTCDIPSNRVEHHKKIFDGFEEFLETAGVK